MKQFRAAEASMAVSREQSMTMNFGGSWGSGGGTPRRVALRVSRKLGFLPTSFTPPPLEEGVIAPSLRARKRPGDSISVKPDVY